MGIQKGTLFCSHLPLHLFYWSLKPSWQGQGLGKDEQGIATPIAAFVSPKKHMSLDLVMDYYHSSFSHDNEVYVRPLSLSTHLFFFLVFFLLFWFKCLVYVSNWLSRSDAQAGEDVNEDVVQQFSQVIQLLLYIPNFSTSLSFSFLFLLLSPPSLLSILTLL